MNPGGGDLLLWDAMSVILDGKRFGYRSELLCRTLLFRFVFFFREGKFVKLPKIEGLGCDGAVPGPQCRPSAVENGRIGL